MKGREARGKGHGVRREAQGTARSPLVLTEGGRRLGSHLTPHTSHLTPHTSHLTPHTSHLTPHTSHLTPHTSLLVPMTCQWSSIWPATPSPKPSTAPRGGPQWRSSLAWGARSWNTE
ncbi:hypothetical protein EKG36_18000 [Halomonas nitroreducens]|uniref:Uncharacterized protein n=1 Tax=Halomonas nitroreducens TaxID=447425 RepID=A0A3S0J789_9GAMM|nr:hypothetical protein EKG36_18000 [Halomonas nitroreducens]